MYFPEFPVLEVFVGNHNHSNTYTDTDSWHYSRWNLSGSCHLLPLPLSLLYLPKLTRLLGSPGTKYIIDLPAVNHTNYIIPVTYNSCLFIYFFISSYSFHLPPPPHTHTHTLLSSHLFIVNSSSSTSPFRLTSAVLTPVCPEAPAGEHPAAEQRRTPLARGRHQQDVQASSAPSTHGHPSHRR